MKGVAFKLVGTLIKTMTSHHGLLLANPKKKNAMNLCKVKEHICHLELVMGLKYITEGMF